MDDEPHPTCIDDATARSRHTEAKVNGARLSQNIPAEGVEDLPAPEYLPARRQIATRNAMSEAVHIPSHLPGGRKRAVETGRTSLMAPGRLGQVVGRRARHVQIDDSLDNYWAAAELHENPAKKRARVLTGTQTGGNRPAREPGNPHSDVPSGTKPPSAANPSKGASPERGCPGIPLSDAPRGDMDLPPESLPMGPPDSQQRGNARNSRVRAGDTMRNMH